MKRTYLTLLAAFLTLVVLSGCTGTEVVRFGNETPDGDEPTLEDGDGAETGEGSETDGDATDGSFETDGDETEQDDGDETEQENETPVPECTKDSD